MINSEQLETEVEHFWDEHVTPTLIDYIKIPNKSPHFDAAWEENGHMEDALQLALSWLDKHKEAGWIVHVGRQDKRTPLLLVEIPGEIDGNILMYGHLDKQPEMDGWRDDLGPWKPVLEEGKLYGRGGADDGYALFASVCALKTLTRHQVKLPKITVLIEFSEESGSIDLASYVEQYRGLLGKPDLVVCLDTGPGNYEQFWFTTSLRGVLYGELRVDILNEGVHSGYASGVVPSSFRLARQLLSRLEDESTGTITPEALQVPIPTDRIKEAEKAAKGLKDDVYLAYPFIEGSTPMGANNVERILNRTWRASLSVTGQAGLPSCEDGGNVLRPQTTLKLSFRLPPTLSAETAAPFIEKTLTENPPHGAKVQLSLEGATGWNAPSIDPALFELVSEASETFYKKPALAMGEGGTIPFMGMLGDLFPDAQFIITGVLGPESNAHGPNEFLHIPYAKKLTACITHVLERYRL